jgi:hypothetical protein
MLILLMLVVLRARVCMHPYKGAAVATDCKQTNKLLKPVIYTIQPIINSSSSSATPKLLIYRLSECSSCSAMNLQMKCHMQYPHPYSIWSIGWLMIAYSLKYANRRGPIIAMLKYPDMPSYKVLERTEDTLYEARWKHAYRKYGHEKCISHGCVEGARCVWEMLVAYPSNYPRPPFSYIS